MENKELIEKFYQAFARRDGEAMARLYHTEVVFEDPVFGELKGEEAGNMWRMLCESADAEMKVSFETGTFKEDRGNAKWEAIYKFSKTGRMVHNKISAKFRFKNGLIIDHRDDFNFYKWTRMALGVPGVLLGWTPFMKNKIRATVKKALRKYSQTRS